MTASIQVATALAYSVFTFVIILRQSILERCIQIMSYISIAVFTLMTWVQVRITLCQVLLYLFGSFCLLPLALIIQLSNWHTSLPLFGLAQVYPLYLVIT